MKLTNRRDIHSVTMARVPIVLAVARVVIAACSADVSTPAQLQSLGSSSPAASADSVVRSPSSGASPEASDPASPLTIAWEPSEPFDGQVWEVYADADTWIAGGWDAADGPVAWTATDARTWVRSDVENQQPDETFGGPRLGPMTRLGDSLLSFGTFIGCCDGRGVYGWRSADGTSWEAIESASPLFATGYFVHEIAAGDPVLVAVESQFALDAGRLWTWTEASSWVETTPGSSGDASSGIQPVDVVWSDDRFVAVGARGDPEFREPSTATSWVSTDGRTWEESVPGDAERGIVFSAVAPLPAGGFAALGSVATPGSGPDATFTSTSLDGLAWTAAPEPLDAADGNADLVVVPGGLVALVGGSTWTTRAGITWADAGSLDRGSLTAAAMDDEIVVFSADFENATWSIQRGIVGD